MNSERGLQEDDLKCVLCGLADADMFCDNKSCKMAWHKSCSEDDLDCPFKHLNSNRESQWDNGLSSSVSSASCCHLDQERPPAPEQLFRHPPEHPFTFDVLGCGECKALICTYCNFSFYETKTIGSKYKLHWRPNGYCRKRVQNDENSEEAKQNNNRFSMAKCLK